MGCFDSSKMSKQGNFRKSRRPTWPTVGCPTARLGVDADNSEFETPQFVCRADQLNDVACRPHVILYDRPGWSETSGIVRLDALGELRFDLDLSIMIWPRARRACESGH